MTVKGLNVGVALSCASIGLACFLTAPASADDASHSTKHQPLMTVNGHGEIHVRPDRATIRLAVESQAETATAAQSAVNDSMQQVLKQVKPLGIAENDIQTAGLNLAPIYSVQKPGEESVPPHVIAYRASNTIQVKVHDLNLVGRVIDAGLTNGANRLEGVTFDLKDETPARAKALERAAHDARIHAQALADSLDLQLQRTAEVKEGAVNTTPPRPMALSAIKSASFPATPVEPGQITVQASVTVQYVIADKDQLRPKNNLRPESLSSAVRPRVP